MGCYSPYACSVSAMWDVVSSMWAVIGEDRERRQGTKTENEGKEPRLRTKIKNGERIIRKDKDGEKSSPCSFPVRKQFLR